MTKKSSYQKIKEENLKLKKDIYALVENPNSELSIKIRLKRTVEMRVDEAMMSGKNLDGIRAQYHGSKFSASEYSK